jgi:hypothetical protein
MFNYTLDMVNKLDSVNSLLKIKKNDNRKLVFIYTPPKVGSTSLVTSFRLYCIKEVHVIHIHDETMLKVLGIDSDVSIKEIINYNAYIGRNVYVIDVYRTPIERKMSSFFEKIGTLHFNNDDKIVNKYGINIVNKRFNNIFEHIANGDYFLDNFELLNIPENFDFMNKYLLINNNDVKYIKLRLIDSGEWGKILSKLLNINLNIITDYEAKNKEIGQLYDNFKKNYKIPMNYFNNIINDKYFNYYLSSDEKSKYIDEWNKKIDYTFIGYTSEQYNLYKEISLENGIRDVIKKEHYIDEGCRCESCDIKREKIKNKLLKNITLNNDDKIVHEWKTKFPKRLIKNNRPSLRLFSSLYS